MGFSVVSGAALHEMEDSVSTLKKAIFMALVVCSPTSYADWREVLKGIAQASLEGAEKGASPATRTPDGFPVPETPITDYSQEYQIYLGTREFSSACTDGPRRSESGYSNADCSKFIISALNADLKARNIQPTNCREFGIYSGYGEPPLNMRESLTGASSIVSFAGSVEDGDSKSLIVFNKAYGSSQNASVQFSKQTKIMKDVSVGGYASGFGRVTGSMPVTLVSGQQTRIPVISAICLN